MSHQKTKKRIALDVDGVLFNFTEEVDKAAEIVLGRKIIPGKDSENFPHYHLGKRFNVTIEQEKEILEYMIQTKMYAHLKPFDKVKEAIQAIEADNFEIYVVTALPETAKAMRLENLKRDLDLIPKEIYCVGMGLNKADALREVDPDVFIDDRVNYLADAPYIYHLALVDQNESQYNKSFQVDTHVRSLEEWTIKHMPRVSKKLNRYYESSLPLQQTIKLENLETAHIRSKMGF